MSLVKGERAISSHALFFPAGKAYTVPSSGTAGRSAKPGAGDAGWINMGIIKMSKDAIGGEKKETFAPVPGKKVRYDIHRLKETLTHKFTCLEITPLAIQCLYRTLALDESSSQFNALEGVEVKGWLKVQRYNKDNSLVMVFDHFVDLEVSGEVDFSGEDMTTVDFEAAVLHSTLNTGTL